MKNLTLDALLKSLNEDSNINDLIQSSPICHKIFDLNLKLRFMSNSGVATLQIENVEDYYGHTFPTDAAPKISRDIFDEAIRLATKGRANTIEYSFEVDGNTIWYRTTISPFFNTASNLIYITADSMDITDKENAEINLKKSRQELRDLSNKLQTVHEEEKKRISREIHDELGQALTAIKLELTWLEKRIDVSEHPFHEKIKSIYSLLDDSFETIRRVSTELRPQVLDVMGFCEALQWQAEKFAENTNIKYKLHIKPDAIQLHPELSTDLFRIFQEALTNVSRHSQASNVNVNFFENKTEYELSVQDDGVGIDSLRLNHSGSLGLLGMRERALLWKGSVEIKGVAGKGTLLKVKIPKLNNEK